MAFNKAMVCIDNGYFTKLCQGLGKHNVHLHTFVKAISQLSKADQFTPYLYDCMPYQSKAPTQDERERYAKKDKFLSHLGKSGFIIRLGKLQRLSKDDFKQKKVDTLWTADVSKLAFTKQIDCVILVSGDSDFIPGVLAAQEAGVHTVLWYAQTSTTGTSFELIKTCDEVHKITAEFLDQCRLTKDH